DPLVPDAHHRGSCLCVVADQGGLVHAESHPEPAAADMGRWAPLPSLGTIIEWRQASPPHLIVLVDREGADLILYRGASEPVLEEVKAGRHPLHKARSGGWSERHHQLRVEERWKESASNVASEVAQLAKAYDVRVVAVAGDTRTVELLRSALPTEVAELVVGIDGSRAVDGSTDAVADASVRAVASVVASDTTDALRKFHEQLGEGNRAVQGAAGTLGALAGSQVGLLMVHEDPDDGRQAFFGPEAHQVAGTAEDVRAMGVAEPRQARLVDVCIRAALGTGAGVRVVPRGGGPEGGVGAILRWS
ncbi:MAG TPA: Vms1/Ankzf1 family peptidyl-tRNA hydrolase, partial [Acidimicrobiales bacterium]|nr:Vms1/Ankzf1 family peptidyl-tRNA hydrolase [Acidimicrobiales bacterium]